MWVSPSPIRMEVVESTVERPDGSHRAPTRHRRLLHRCQSGTRVLSICLDLNCAELHYHHKIRSDVRLPTLACLVRSRQFVTALVCYKFDLVTSYYLGANIQQSRSCTAIRLTFIFTCKKRLEDIWTCLSQRRSTCCLRLHVSCDASEPGI